jgi:hypothetical protein
MQDWLNYLDFGFKQAAEGSENVPDSMIKMAGMTGHVFEAANSGFPIIIEFWRQAITEPDIWKEAVKPYNNYLDFFEGLIVNGIKEGSLQKSVDPGYLLQASFDPNGASWSEVTQSGMRIIINGMRRSE